MKEMKKLVVKDEEFEVVDESARLQSYRFTGGTRLRGTQENPINLNNFWDVGNYYIRNNTEANPNYVHNMPSGLNEAFLMKSENASGDLTQNPLVRWSLQTIKKWDGTEEYSRWGKITLDSSGNVTASEWSNWTHKVIKLPLSEEQQNEFNRMWTYGDILGGDYNKFINWQEGIINPVYFGGSNFVVTDIHAASNFTKVVDFVIANKAKITCFVNCGDNVYSNFTHAESAQWMVDVYDPQIKRIMNVGIPYISCVGNHDAVNASINDLVSMIAPQSMYFDNAKVKAGIYTVDGYVTDGDDQIDALKARHLGYLYIVKNKNTQYIQPYLVLNCYDIDVDNDYSVLLRDSNATSHYSAYLSKTQVSKLMQDLKAFYDAADLSKVMPLVTISHHTLADQTKTAMNHVAVKGFVQKRFKYGANPTVKPYFPYAHRFQMGGQDWIQEESDNNNSRITYLGMVAGSLGLTNDSDVVCFGSAITGMPEGTTSDWTLTKAELTSGSMIEDLYKHNGINLCGHLHVDYTFINATGAAFSGSYASEHVADVALCSVGLLAASTLNGHRKYNDLIYDGFYMYNDVEFTMFGYTASGYKATGSYTNDKVEWMLNRFGARKTMGNVDRSVEYFGYSAGDLSVE